MQVVANERVRTEHACVPADIVQTGGHLLLGYNVFFGMKKEVAVEDVFSIQTFDGSAPRARRCSRPRSTRCPGSSTASSSSRTSRTSTSTTRTRGCSG
ncbi:DNA repair ATPase [Nannocystis pusilla]|uniref:DNA repair ATPase n=1 Tax=Nannocystis pusilla TaxID=889268 RepID=UPI003B81BD21